MKLYIFHRCFCIDSAFLRAMMHYMYRLHHQPMPSPIRWAKSFRSFRPERHQGKAPAGCDFKVFLARKEGFEFWTFVFCRAHHVPIIPDLSGFLWKSRLMVLVCWDPCWRLKGKLRHPTCLTAPGCAPGSSGH